MDQLTMLLILLVALLLVYYFVLGRMTHFKKLGIPYDPPIPILGNMAPIIFRRKAFVEHLKHLYNRYSDVKYFGFYNFGAPVIVIRDPELVTSIAVKNFDQFCDHRGFVDENLDPLMGKNLFSLKGDEWRDMRRLLSPSFTTSKMKIMFNLICDCANNFTNFIANDSKEGKAYEAKEILGRYTNDVIATCSFGYAVDSMKNPTNEFYMFAKETMDFSSSLSFKFILGKNFPILSKLFKVRLFSDKARKYFSNVIKETVKIREEKGIYRPDMIQLMMETFDKGVRALSLEDMTYQAFVFFFAGFETSSTIATFVIHEVAVNPDVQEKLREEIKDVIRKVNGKLTYEAINDMQYMEAVLNEVLRMYPVLPFLDRQCIEEFQLPAAKPGSKPVTIKPGELVWFVPLGFQRDPKYFPDPLKFKPERFLEGQAASSSLLTFGTGPRICIAKRFALMEIKILLFYLLSRCDLEPCDKTDIPLKLNRKTFVMQAKDGGWLKIKAREDGDILSEGHGSSNGVLSEAA